LRNCIEDDCGPATIGDAKPVEQCAAIDMRRIVDKPATAPVAAAG